MTTIFSFLRSIHVVVGALLLIGLGVYAIHRPPVKLVTDSQNPAWCAAFSDDGKWLITGNHDGTARLWDLSLGQQIRVFRGHTGPVLAVALSHDGKRLITGSTDKTARLWEVATGRSAKTFTGHQGAVNAAALTSDGKALVTGSEDKTASLWSLETGKSIRSFASADHSVEWVGLAHGDEWLVTGGTFQAQLWDVKTGKDLTAGHKAFAKRPSVLGMAVGHNRPWLIRCRAAVQNGPPEDQVEVWDLESETLVHALKKGLRQQNIDGVAISTDDKRVITVGNLDGNARVFDLATGTQVLVLEGQFRKWSQYYRLPLSANGKWLLSFSYWEGVGLIDLTTGRKVCRLESFTDGTWAVIDGQDRFDAANNGKVDGLSWEKKDYVLHTLFGTGTKTYALERFKDQRFDPGLLAKLLGSNNQPLRNIKALEE